MKVKVLFLVIVFLALTTAVWSAPFLVCDPPQAGEQLDYYVVEIGNRVLNHVEPDPTGKYGFKVDLYEQVLPDGDFTAKAKAVNIWGESEWSDPFVFSKGLPGKPGGVRLSKE